MPATMPKVDLIDPSDEELVQLAKYYHEIATDKSLVREQRLGIAIAGFEIIAERIQARIDWKTRKHQEFRDYIRQPRVRDAAWEAGCNERGEL